MIKKLILLKVYEVSSGYIEFTSTIIFRYMQKQLQEVFYAKDVFRNLTKFTGKQLFHRLFFDKAAGLLFYRTPGMTAFIHL